MKVKIKKETGLYLCEANTEGHPVFTAKSEEMEEKAKALGGVAGRYGSAVASYEPIVEEVEKEVPVALETKCRMLMILQKWYIGRGLVRELGEELDECH